MAPTVRPVRPPCACCRQSAHRDVADAAPAARPHDPGRCSIKGRPESVESRWSSMTSRPDHAHRRRRSPSALASATPRASLSTRAGRRLPGRWPDPHPTRKKLLLPRIRPAPPPRFYRARNGPLHGRHSRVRVAASPILIRIRSGQSMNCHHPHEILLPSGAAILAIPAPLDQFSNGSRHGKEKSEKSLHPAQAFQVLLNSPV